ncbi:hypothetical protein SprV_0501953300 [Sparganum proliferum]
MIFHSPSRFTVSKVHEGRVQVDPHLLALLLELTGGEDHIRGPTMMTEAALAFLQEALFQMDVQAIEENASEDFPGDVQQGDATVVVADLAVPFSLAEMHDGCVFEILRDFTLTPHLLEERSQVIHQLGTAVLVDLIRDCVRSGCFPARELLHGPDGLLEKWREVEVHVGLHLRQAVDGGDGDSGGAVEDASEVFGPTLENLRLLGQEGTTVSAEERSAALRRRTVDRFDSGEEVLPFVAVCVSLDLLSFAGSPGVLHFAQSLLKVAASAVESSFVVVSGVVYVGFV